MATCCPTHYFFFFSFFFAVFFAPDGYLLSNAHVVGTSENVQVTLTDGRRMTASVIGTDPSTDLAVCQIDNLQGAEIRRRYTGDTPEIHSKTRFTTATFGSLLS
jgi:S1-C subfamily serine protease